MEPVTGSIPDFPALPEAGPVWMADSVYFAPVGDAGAGEVSLRRFHNWIPARTKDVILPIILKKTVCPCIVTFSANVRPKEAR